MATRRPGNTKGKAQGPVKPSEKRAEEANPPAKGETPAELSSVDALQLVLDLAGMIPGAGAVPDLLNAAISLMRGDFIGALFSAASAVPVVGDAAGAAKIIKNSEKYLQALKVVETKVLPKLPASMRKPLEEFIAKVRTKIDDILKKDKPAGKPGGKPEKPAEKPAEKGSKGKDNDGAKSEGKTKSRCTLRTYKEGCEGGATPHHVVPDHCFRQPNRQGGKPYPGTEKITHANGLCVCVGGSTKSTGEKGGNVTKGKFKRRLGEWFGALAEHGKIHALMDAQEAALGAANTPKATATLGQLEDAGARSAGLVTGCDPKDLQRQLREHHQKNGLPENTRLRADPFGRKSPDPKTPMGTGQGGAAD